MIYIVSGAIGAGKSYSLMEWSKDRTDVCGVLTLRMDGEIRYFYDLKCREQFEMETSSTAEDVIAVGRYHFSKTAFKRANHIIEKSLENNTTGYLIIDELGKLEMRSEGLHKSAELAIERTMHDKMFHLILVVRTSLLTEITKKYNIHSYEGIDKAQLSEKLTQTV